MRIGETIGILIWLVVFLACMDRAIVYEYYKEVSHAPPIYQKYGEKLRRYNSELTVNRSNLIGLYIQKYSNAYEVDPLLILSIIIVESHGDNTRVSHAKACGVMQIMPATASLLGIKEGYCELETNIKLGSQLLADNMRLWGERTGVQKYFWGVKVKPTGVYISKVDRVYESIAS